MVRVIEMAFLYTARHLFVLLRPKDEVKLPTQSAENRICMRNELYIPRGATFSRTSERPQTFKFFGGSVCYQCRPWKRLSKKLHQGRWKKVLSQVFFYICKLWPRKPTFWPSKTLINSSTKFGLSMTNDGALESWHKGGFYFDYLAGGKNNYKNKLSVQGKQTVVYAFDGIIAIVHCNC